MKKFPITCIESKDVAERVFTAKYLFILNECKKAAAEDLRFVTTAEYNERRKNAALNFAKLSSDHLELWEMKRRAHLLQWDYIPSRIADSMTRNPKRSWSGIEHDLGYWCSATTIRRYLTSRIGYRLYAERVIPNLSAEQKIKHFTFARHFLNNWGLGSGRYLLFHYDEKWFWGLVMRRGAKACEELGVDQAAFAAYHRNHINKVMGIAFTAFAFTDSIMNGGEAVKVGFFRAQSYKVAEKMQRVMVRQADGKMRATGPILRRKGDLYLVDCCVTGGTDGSSTDPKFSLARLFRSGIRPRVKELVGVGGRFEGYTPIFQADSAGPHIEQHFKK